MIKNTNTQTPACFIGEVLVAKRWSEWSLTVSNFLKFSYDFRTSSSLSSVGIGLSLLSSWSTSTSFIDYIPTLEYLSTNLLILEWARWVATDGRNVEWHEQHGASFYSEKKWYNWKKTSIKNTRNKRCDRKKRIPCSFC